MKHALLLLVSFAARAFGQATNQTTAVCPASAVQGTSGLTVTFKLDTDAPPAPPASVSPILRPQARGGSAALGVHFP